MTFTNPRADEDYLASFRKRGNAKEQGYQRHQPTVIKGGFLSLPKSIEYV